MPWARIKCTSVLHRRTAQHRVGEYRAVEREIRPKLTSRTGSAIRVWLWGGALDHRRLAPNQPAGSSREVGQLMGETKLVAAQSLGAAEPTWAPSWGSSPGVPHRDGEGAAAGRRVPEHLQVRSMKVQAHNGLVSLCRPALSTRRRSSACRQHERYVFRALHGFSRPV